MANATEPSFDVDALCREAQRRWLKPSEVFFILKYHNRFPLTLESPKKPPGGSVFLFNRRVLRFFRNDGHSWRKKKDGRTVGEAHEKLKVGNIDALNCYYAHGEDNPCFQRRSYWMLDPAYEHIVLVHYREVTEGRYVSSAILNFSSEFSTRSQSVNASDDQIHSLSSGSVELSKPYVNSPSPGSVEVNSDCIDATSKLGNEASSSQLELNQALRKLTEQLSLDDKDDDISCLGEKRPSYGCQEGEFEKTEYETGDLLEASLEINKYELDHRMQNPFEDVGQDGQSTATDLLDASGEDGMYQNLFDFPPSSSHFVPYLEKLSPPMDTPHQIQQKHGGSSAEATLICDQIAESDYRRQLSDTRKFLLDFDSPIGSPTSATQPLNSGNPLALNCEINISKTLSDLRKESSSDWMDLLAGENDASGLWRDQSEPGPLLTDSSLTTAQRQLFRIREISPEWSFISTSTKIIVAGDFLCDPSGSSWAIMFGDVEVPAEIVQEGVLRCQAPKGGVGGVGKVTFCVTSMNRKPCSEIREFEFFQDPNISGSSGPPSPFKASNRSEEELSFIFRLLHLLFDRDYNSSAQEFFKNAKMIDHQEEVCSVEHLSSSGSPPATMSWVLQELFKDKFNRWLSCKCNCDTGEDSSLSKQEQGILHVISALGYEWALNPILSCGVSVNFRDSNGWTALHWAAHFGNEKMVAALLAAGASASVVTDPTSRDPVGRTPASIASSSGYDGLAGYLSEVALTSHLTSLTMKESEISRGSAETEAQRAVESISQRSDTINTDGLEDKLSLEDSLDAVRNATQAAARIQAAFRAHSFIKKTQRAAFDEDDYGLTPQDILSLSAASKSLKGPHGGSQKSHQAAALWIQKNYRSWKGRKDFLNMRKNVVKIQAHVRGHLFRKKYKEFLWTVSVVEKAILRWRRKGAGLRGFRAEQEKMHEEDEEEEEEDVAKMFRKERVEVALDEALTNVITMAGSPGARQQYRRMLERYRQAKAELSHAAPGWRGGVAMVEDHGGQSLFQER